MRDERILRDTADIPSLGFGTWQLEGKVCRDRVRDALDAGYRHIDTARIYGNHFEVGRGMRESGVERDDVFLVTKLWMEDYEARRVASSFEQSLRDLDTDYVDLLLMHWPSPDVPLQETLGAMVELRESGRVRHLGVSNFPPSWLARACEHAPLVCNQVEYHPLLSQDRLLDDLRDRGMALVAYSPLAHGKVPDHPTLRAIGEAHGKTAAQVALRWLVQQDSVATIPRTSSRSHLRQNLEIFDFELDDDEMERLHELARETDDRCVDPEFAPEWER